MLAGLRQTGSLKMLFPRSDDAGLQAVLVNTAGGVTGGDQFSCTAVADSGTDLCLTTQAAERAYRATPGEIGQLKTKLRVEADARLDWLPQETILYDGCALSRRIRVEMAASARLLLCEPLVFGRAAMGEQLRSGSLQDRVEIFRDDAAIFRDQFHLQGDIAAHLARPTIAAGAGAMASLIYIAPDAAVHLVPIREMLGTTGGASLIAEDMLFLRLLAPDSFALRKSLIPVVTRLSGAPLPRPWMI